MAIKFFLHFVNDGFDTRRDVVILINERVVSVCTVEATSNSLGKPAKVGQTLAGLLEAVEETGIPEVGTVCLCGATEHHHNRSSACGGESHLREIDLTEAINLALEAKRLQPALTIFGYCWKSYRANK